MNQRDNDFIQRSKGLLRPGKHGKVGAMPGTIAPAHDALPPVMDVVAYGPDALIEKSIDNLDEIAELQNNHAIVWLNVVGLGDAALIESIGERFGFHRLALEDVVNTGQRPKVEPFGDYVYMVARMLRPNLADGVEQLSIFIKKGLLITFQEQPGDDFEPVRKRLRNPTLKIRRNGADYLAYALLDAVVDAYFPCLEKTGDELEHIEQRIIQGAGSTVISRLYGLRRDLIVIRRAVWPLRDAVGTILRDEIDLFDDNTRLFLRDLADHAIQVLDLTESHRDMASSLLDLNLSQIGYRQNEIMKVLTIFAAIFIPLSFIAGLYGMNFDPDSPWNMPELRARYGYPILLLVMATVAIGLLIYFRRRGWIGGANHDQPPPDDDSDPGSR